MQTLAEEVADLQKLSEKELLIAVIIFLSQIRNGRISYFVIEDLLKTLKFKE